MPETVADARAAAHRAALAAALAIAVLAAATGCAPTPNPSTPATPTPTASPPSAVCADAWTERYLTPTQRAAEALNALLELAAKDAPHRFTERWRANWTREARLLDRNIAALYAVRFAPPPSPLAYTLREAVVALARRLNDAAIQGGAFLHRPSNATLRAFIDSARGAQDMLARENPRALLPVCVIGAAPATPAPRP